MEPVDDGSPAGAADGPGTRQSTPLAPRSLAAEAAGAITAATEAMSTLRCVATGEPLSDGVPQLDAALSDFDQERSQLRCVVPAADRPPYDAREPPGPQNGPAVAFDFGVAPVQTAEGAAEQIYSQFKAEFHRIIGDTGYPPDLAVRVITTIMASDVSHKHGKLREELYYECELLCGYLSLINI